MDEKFNEKTEIFMDNISTMLGMACLAYPIIRQVIKTSVPEIQKLTSGEALQELKMLPDKQEKQEQEEHKPHDNEIAELRRELAEYKSKSGEHKGDS